MTLGLGLKVSGLGWCRTLGLGLKDSGLGWCKALGLGLKVSYCKVRLYSKGYY